jgi:hypothetical protein
MYESTNEDTGHRNKIGATGKIEGKRDTDWMQLRYRLKANEIQIEGKRDTDSMQMRYRLNANEIKI